MPTIKGWLKPPTSPTKLICRGRVYTLVQHFIPALKSSAACLGVDNCVLCSQGRPIQMLAAVPVSLPGSEVVWLLRVLPNQGTLIQTLVSRGNDLVGTTIEVVRAHDGREGTQNRSARLLVTFHDRVPISTAPVDRYIAAIGQRTYKLMADRVEVESLTLADV